MRKEKPYEVPRFAANNDKPLIYVSFGWLGAGDTDLLKRLIAAVGKLPYRALVNVGDYKDQYTDIPPNVIIDSWFPQPSVIPQVDAVIHHGGNNSFTECLYFGKPAIIMPYVWDGHDNATRVQETGHGFKMPRYDWTEPNSPRSSSLPDRQGDEGGLAATSPTCSAKTGPKKAAEILEARQLEELLIDLASTAPHLHEASTYADWSTGASSPMPRGAIPFQERALVQGAGQPARDRHLGLHAGALAAVHPARRILPFRRRAAPPIPHDHGEVIEVAPGTCVMFPAGGPANAPYTKPSATSICWLSMTRKIDCRTWCATRWSDRLVDWGVIPTMIEGESRTSGKCCPQGPEGQTECGLWVCTPGKWNCHVTRDEYCHFLEGRCTYVHE